MPLPSAPKYTVRNYSKAQYYIYENAVPKNITFNRKLFLNGPERLMWLYIFHIRVLLYGHTGLKP